MNGNLMKMEVASTGYLLYLAIARAPLALHRTLYTDPLTPHEIVGRALGEDWWSAVRDVCSTPARVVEMAYGTI